MPPDSSGLQASQVRWHVRVAAFFVYSLVFFALDRLSQYFGIWEMNLSLGSSFGIAVICGLFMTIVSPALNQPLSRWTTPLRRKLFPYSK